MARIHKWLTTGHFSFGGRGAKASTCSKRPSLVPPSIYMDTRGSMSRTWPVHAPKSHNKPPQSITSPVMDKDFFKRPLKNKSIRRTTSNDSDHSVNQSTKRPFSYRFRIRQSKLNKDLLTCFYLFSLLGFSFPAWWHFAGVFIGNSLHTGLTLDKEAQQRWRHPEDAGSFSQYTVQHLLVEKSDQSVHGVVCSARFYQTSRDFGALYPAQLVTSLSRVHFPASLFVCRLWNQSERRALS